MPDERFIFDQLPEFVSETLPPEEVERLQLLIDNLAKVTAARVYERLQIEDEMASLPDVLMLMGVP